MDAGVLVDAGLLLIGLSYLAVSGLLFLFGANLLAMSILVWLRGGRAARAPYVIETSPPGRYPPVTVQLPIYNELYVAERVIEAACRLDYPPDRLQIQVLDDSTDETTEVVAAAIARARCDGVDIVHIHRSDRVGYKAGALRAGTRTATGELIALFDADFVPPPDFLIRTVDYFDQPDVAFVQARWGHVNRRYSWLTRLQSLAIDGHFLVEQAARGLQGYWFNFNGTAGIWRAAAIEDAGGWTTDTLTEDLDLSYRAHLRGWHGLYRVDLEVPGEVPAQMSGFRRQQHRWARGSLECARKLLPAVWRSNAGLATKFQATAHLLSYGIHLLLLGLVILYPPVIAAGARFPGLTTLFGLGYLFGISSLAPGVFFAAAQRERRSQWWRELPRIVAVTVLGSGLMINTARAAIEILTKPNPAFERTAKFGLVEAAPGDRWRAADRYHLDLDRIVAVEALLGCYALGTAWLAATNGNWGIMAFSAIFGTGLLSVVGLSVGQALGLQRTRADRMSSASAVTPTEAVTEPR